MECIVQGVLETQHVVALEVLLQGLCGGICENIKVHELCLKSGPNLGASSSEIYLLCSLSKSEPEWALRHVGGSMRGAGADQLPALVRSVLEADIGPNALPFLYALGYKLDSELLRAGFCFHFNRTVPITVRVSSICRLPKLHAVDEAVPVTPSLHLVEVMASASSENYVEVVNAISAFSEFLTPLLHLSKPGVFMGVAPTAATAAAALISRASMKMT